MGLNYKSNRRLKNFQVRKVRESLPEIFTQDFSKLVTFLEKYYDFLDSSGGSHAFGDDIKQIFLIEHILETLTIDQEETMIQYLFSHSLILLMYIIN